MNTKLCVPSCSIKKVNGIKFVVINNCTISIVNINGIENCNLIEVTIPKSIIKCYIIRLYTFSNCDVDLFPTSLDK